MGDVWGRRLTDQLPVLTVGNIVVALFALPLVSVVRQRGVLAVGPVGELAIQWGVATVIVGVAVGIEGQSLAELGFRRPAWVDLGYTVGTAIVALLVFAGTDSLVAELGLPVRGDSGMMTAGVGVGIALAGAATTGIVEEILFRGYPIERVLDFVDRPLVAGGCSWLAFTVAHAPVWPAGNLLQIAAVAAVFTGVYIARRSLVPVIGTHVLVWMISVLGQFYG